MAYNNYFSYKRYFCHSMFVSPDYYLQLYMPNTPNHKSSSSQLSLNSSQHRQLQQKRFICKVPEAMPRPVFSWSKNKFVIHSGNAEIRRIRSTRNRRFPDPELSQRGPRCLDRFSGYLNQNAKLFYFVYLLQLLLYQSKQFKICGKKPWSSGYGRRLMS